MIKREVKLDRVISFLISSELKIIRLICNIGIIHIINAKVRFNKLKEGYKEMEYLSEEIKIICDYSMYYNDSCVIIPCNTLCRGTT